MIFLAGPHGAGKTTSSKLLVSYGFQEVDLGPTLRRIHQKCGTKLEFQDWCSDGTCKFGPTFTDAMLVNEINLILDEDARNATHFLDLLVVGSRSAEGITYLKQHVRQESIFPDIVVFLDASTETLRRNFNTREGKDFSAKEFAEILARDIEMGIESIRSICDYVIRNEGSLEMLEASLHSLIFDTLKYRRRSNVNERRSA